jgi:hypothetical protein
MPSEMQVGNLTYLVIDNSVVADNRVVKQS